jgi:hypothetical protein
MKRLMVVVLGAVLLGGCYSVPHWAPGPEARDRNFKRDDYQCVMETRGGGAGGVGIGAAVAINSYNQDSRRLYTACMQLKGWTLTEEGGVKGGWRPL